MGCLNQCCQLNVLSEDEGTRVSYSDTASMYTVSSCWCLEVTLNILLGGIFVFKLIDLLLDF